jgi:hypothetical protein
MDGHVARVKEKGIAYRALIEKSAVKRPLERNKLRWKNNVQLGLKGTIMGWCHLYSSIFLVLKGLFANSNEHPGSTYFSELFNSPSNFWLLKSESSLLT